ncbi:MAG: hypothetical protein B7Z16_06895 [Algoriphagus sp. 32-45-6]|nr:MAG: hypothetical protein B7Z16_06895 [Algoriphagus sp. 32-45-6]
MKKKTNKDNPKTSTRNLVYAYLTIAALLVTATALVYWINHQQLQPSIGYSPDEIERPVEPSLVCMVNDAYMGKPQIPVPVNGKTYYGCCEMCVDKLNNIESARIAIDPFSGNQVDKSEAFIVVTNTQGAVTTHLRKTKNNPLTQNL